MYKIKAIISGWDAPRAVEWCSEHLAEWTLHSERYGKAASNDVSDCRMYKFMGLGDEEIRIEATIKDEIDAMAFKLTWS